MFRFFRDLWRLMRGKPFGCEHKWCMVKHGVRDCEICGKREYMTFPKYPQAQWK